MKSTKHHNSKYIAEKEFINTLDANYVMDEQTQTMRKLVIRTFSPFIKGGIGLELGCSDGYMTQMLSENVDELHVVDASQRFLAEANSRKLPHIKLFHSLFEEYETTEKYDYVFASFVMEHVLEVQPVLAMVNRVLKPAGKLFIVVPNARALSRQLALHMGIIGSLYDLTENDLKFGHRRVYDRVNLNRDVEKAGFTTIAQGGIMLKILADFQMHRLIESAFLQDEHIDGLYKLGLEYPDLCGALFSICALQ